VSTVRNVPIFFTWSSFRVGSKRLYSIRIQTKSFRIHTTEAYNNFDIWLIFTHNFNFFRQKTRRHRGKGISILRQLLHGVMRISCYRTGCLLQSMIYARKTIAIDHQTIEFYTKTMDVKLGYIAFSDSTATFVTEREFSA
jgi:hypothetical protein